MCSHLEITEDQIDEAVDDLTGGEITEAVSGIHEFAFQNACMVERSAVHEARLIDQIRSEIRAYARLKLERKK